MHTIPRPVLRGLVLAAACVACGPAAAQATAPAAAGAASPAAGTALAAPPASAAPAPRQAPLGCLIEPSAVVDVGTPVIGVLADVFVDRGSVVRRGQTLAQHDTKVERAAVQLAQARVDNVADIQAAQSQIEFAQKKAERTAQLTEMKFVSSQARDQADAEAELARTRLAQAREQQALAAKELQLARAQLAQRTITSPIDGVVVERYAAAGERIENRPVFRVAQIDPLRVEVVLPAAMFGQVRPGMAALVRPELPGVAEQAATVAIVDRVIDAASHTFRVRLTLPNRDQSLPSGVRCKVEFKS